MAEANPTVAKPKSKPEPVALPFENAFAVASIETPAVLRELAERGISQAKDNFDKMKSAAEEAGNVIETTCTSATKGATDYGLKLIEAARVNANAAFDYVGELVMAKSPSEVVELSTTHARKQFEVFTTQMHELTNLAQKIVAETAEPLKAGVSRVAKKVA